MKTVVLFLLAGIAGLLPVTAAGLFDRHFGPQPVVTGVRWHVVATGDTSLFRISWTTTRGPRQARIDSFLVDIRHELTDSVLVSSVVIPPQQEDTLPVVVPAIGDTVGPIFARVQAVDSLGVLSPPGVSASRLVIGTPIPPSAPAVTVDTIPTLQALFEARLDSMELLPLDQRTRLYLRGYPALSVGGGQTIRFCTFIPAGDIIGVAPYNDFCLARAELFRQEVGL